MTQYIKLSTAPEIKRLITAAFPNYRKTTASLQAFPEHGVNINSYWDGGSRDEYALVEISTGRRKSLPTASHPYYDIAGQGLLNADSPDVSVDHVGNVRLKRLPEGIALISAGTFCGKPATAGVYLAAENIAKLLPAKTVL